MFKVIALSFFLQAQPFDIVIQHARIVDGSGNPWYNGNIGIRGDTIVSISNSDLAPAKLTIDARGLVVSPGFIDIHTHARRGIFEVPTAPNYVRQGVTTVIEGPDGSSPLPLAPFLAKLNDLHKTPNIGFFVGQGSVREAVIGSVDRKATADELQKERDIVEQAMKDGAFGLSTGLFYVPGTFTPTEEVIELARVAGTYGGMHESHQRDEASKLIDSVKETIRIGEEGHLPTQISHAKAMGVASWGKSEEMLRLVDEARARGVDVTLDQYPYTASSTSVAAALMPAWLLEGGNEKTLARLKDPTTRAKAKLEVIDRIKNERGGGDPKNVQFASCAFDPSLNGKNLADATHRRDMTETV